ncbi:MAG TPA: hypothetical protein VEX14_03895 [Burkholderiaceae bacterium]|nr:hypothetical protein [Burkholderiaceae bacterium]
MRAAHAPMLSRAKDSAAKAAKPLSKMIRNNASSERRRDGER